MPLKDPEKRRQYNKEYRENNKEKKKQYDKEYLEKNKKKLIEYRQTKAFKKSMRICQWKRNGIITDDYDALYEKFINTENCELCNIVLTTDRYSTKTRRCLDHDHTITDCDNVRNILCGSCNSSLPKQI